MTTRRINAFILAAALFMGLAASAGPEAPENDIFEEAWESVFMAGTHVGYAHTLVRVENEPERLFVSSVFGETHLKRLGADIVLRTQVEFKEKPGGKIVSVVNRTLMSGVETVSTCVPRDGTMHIATTTAGAVHEQEIPWDDSVLGPWAQTLLMRGTERKPGVSVEFKAFVPDFLRVAASVVTMEKKERVVVNGEEMELLAGTMTQDILPGVVTRIWLDDKADVIRSYTDVMGGIETIRTTRAEAMRAVVPKEMADVMTRFSLHSNVKLENPRAIREALYRVEGDPETLDGLDLADRRQTVEERAGGAIVLRVRALPDAEEPAAKTPGSEYLESSPYIQCADEAIARAARKAAGDAATLREKAKRLETWVYKKVKKKNFNVGFASAKEVLASREGDCTEHSVLLAAMLRAEGIPARVAVGLVYWKGIFGYHMWTEAFLNDWTALDATLAGETVDATHIKFAADPLNKPGAATPFVSLVPAVGKIRLTVLETSE